MAEIQETEVERDADGRVVGYQERITERIEDDRRATRRKGGGFGWGLLLGVLLLAVVVIGYAYSQGSFQQAGRNADHAVAQVERQADDVAGQTDAALRGATQSAQRAADNTTNEQPETGTN